MSEEELKFVQEMTVFISFFYVKIWFESTFAVSAARNDLQFMANMLSRVFLYEAWLSYDLGDALRAVFG